jgi:hypothetical protein
MNPEGVEDETYGKSGGGQKVEVAVGGCCLLLRGEGQKKADGKKKTDRKEKMDGKRKMGAKEKTGGKEKIV